QGPRPRRGRVGGPVGVNGFVRAGAVRFHATIGGMSARSRWRVWSWVGLIVIGTALLVVSVLMFMHRESLGVLLAALSTPAIAGIEGLWRQVRPSAVESRGAVTQAADELARTIHRQWVDAAAERRLRYPAPVEVRWRWSRRPVTGSAQEAVDSAYGRVRFRPLPGAQAATEASLGS